MTEALSEGGFSFLSKKRREEEKKNSCFCLLDI